MRGLIQADANRPEDQATTDAHQAPELAEATATTIEPTARPLPGASGTPVQFDFGF